MKINSLIAILSIILVIGCKDEDNDSPIITGSDTLNIEMGTNSINDVYYSLSGGTVKTTAKSLWDIAFSVPLQTASIIINEGGGVELYCAGDTNAWSSINASTITSLEKRYNDKSDWMKGAFNHNNIEPYNYGWGTYNMKLHNVYGDSIYMIKLTDGSLKKLWIKERIGASDTYVLRWADPDGQNEVNTTFSPAPYSTKHFIHYSIVGQEKVEVEPDMATWDLLFTSYVAKVPTGPSSSMNYPVMGILANKSVTIAEVSDIDPVSAVLSDTTTGFSTQTDLIGWDWKENDRVTHAYTIVPNTCYFVKQAGGDIYKLYFTAYGGNSAGSVTIVTQLME